MSQIPPLTLGQIESCINNIAHLRHCKPPEKIFSGKPSFSKDIMTKYGLTESYTKFASNYVIYKMERDTDEPIKTELNEMYASDIKILNGNKRVEIIIVVEDTKFDKQFFLAISGLYYIFKDIVTVRNDTGSPYVTIIPSFFITPIMYSHFPSEMIPISYRFIPIHCIYPSFGSRTRIGGMAYDYELIERLELYNHKEYKVIYDSDPIVKALGGMPGQLIACRCVYMDESPSSEYEIREIKSTLINSDAVELSGIVRV